MRSFILIIAAWVIVWSSPAVSQTEGAKLGPVPIDQQTPEARSTQARDVPSPFLDALTFAERRQRLLSNSGRILGGLPAPIGAYPWLVSIGLAGQPFSIGHFCGGALISDQWVVTAAHCFKGVTSPQQIQVKYGSNLLSQGGKIVSVQDFKRHNGFNPLTFENDLALIRLATRAEEAIAIRYLKEAEAGPVFYDGVLAVVAGWGWTKEGAWENADALRHVGVQIVSNVTCNGPQSYGGRVKEGMFCAGFVEGGHDSCQNDSGGPFMLFDRKGGYVLGGVVSWGEGCARPNKYGVYTRLSKYIEWIEEQAR